MIFTHPKTRAERFSLCQSCDFFKPETQSCGTFLPKKAIEEGSLKGDLVSIPGKKKKVRLCGCHMGQKVKFKMASCPAGKWKSEVSLKDKLKLKSLFKKRPQSMTRQEVKEFVEAYNQAFGAKKQVKQATGCGGCLRQMVDETISSLDNE